MEFERRIAAVREAVQEADADAFVVTGSANTFYLTGFYTPVEGPYPVVVVRSDGEAVLVASRLDVDEAADASAVDVVVPDEGLLDCIADQVDGDHVVVDGDLPIRMKAWLDDRFTVRADMETLSDLRTTKEDGEVDAIRAAYHLAEQVLDAALDDIRPGMTEEDAAAELEYMLRRRGSQGPPFPTVVASGDHAQVPHHTTADAAIADGPLLFDFGTRIDGYVSDLSRTVHVGEPSEAFRDAHDAVRRAQEAAEQALAPDVEAGTVDAAARKVLEDAGFPDTYPHATGHGVGISVHEDPKLSRDVSTELQPGHVVTIEPGLYLDGTGIRIEDAYVVTENGADRLTTSSRDLRILDT